MSLGTCLFTILSFEIAKYYSGESIIGSDPLRVIQAVAIGIGFLGAGVIFRQPSKIVGLTTAAGLWVTAAVGIAVGTKLYFLAIFTTFLSLLVLSGFGLLESKILKTEE